MFQHGASAAGRQSWHRLLEPVSQFHASTCTFEASMIHTLRWGLAATKAYRTVIRRVLPGNLSQLPSNGTLHRDSEVLTRYEQNDEIALLSDLSPASYYMVNFYY